MEHDSDDDDDDDVVVVVKVDENLDDSVGMLWNARSAGAVAWTPKNGHVIFEDDDDIVVDGDDNEMMMDRRAATIIMAYADVGLQPQVDVILLIQLLVLVRLLHTLIMIMIMSRVVVFWVASITAAMEN